jgi:CelD/BcsL family acetyltransferase involved in cellulose biosynthesis
MATKSTTSPTLTGISTAIATEPAASVSITFHRIEEIDRQHLSSRYWNWCELFDRDPQALIAQHPEHLLSQSAEDVVLGEVTRDGQVIALAVLAAKSVTLRRAGGFGPNISLRGYRLVGNRLLGVADPPLTRQLLAACAHFAREQRATYLLIEDLERSDPLFAAAESLARDGFRLFSPTGLQERLKIEFPPSPADYWAKFSSKTRNTFKRKQKKIGATRLVRVTEPEQVGDFLVTAHEISKRTWQSDQLGLRIQNNDTELRFFTVLATQRSLRSYLLFVDEQPAAFLFGTQHKGLFSYEEVGYAREFADRSPGQVLLLQVLEDLLKDAPPRVFDFGGGAADYKQLFATSASTSGSVWLVPPGVRPQLWLAYLRGCRSLDRCARAIANKLGATTLLRQLIRGKHAAARTQGGTPQTNGKGVSEGVDRDSHAVPDGRDVPLRSSGGPVETLPHEDGGTP